MTSYSAVDAESDQDTAGDVESDQDTAVDPDSNEEVKALTLKEVNISRALEAIDRGISIRNAAEDIGIPVTTLAYRVKLKRKNKKLKNRKKGFKPWLNCENEETSYTEVDAESDQKMNALKNKKKGGKPSLKCENEETLYTYTAADAESDAAADAESDQEIKAPSLKEVNIRRALKAMDNGMSLRNAAKVFDLPVTTLHYRVKLKRQNKKLKKKGRKPLLKCENDGEVADWCIQMMKCGFLILRSDLKQIVKHILDKKNVTVFSPENLPPDKWVSRFLDRHSQFAHRIPENKEGFKFKSQLCSSQIQAFFEGLKNFLHIEQELEADRFLSSMHKDRVFNFDVISFSLDAEESLEYLVRKCSKNTHSKRGESKEVMNVLLCVSAAGGLVNPLMVNKGEIIPAFQQYPDLDMDSFCVSSSDTGYMTADVFYSWIAKVFYRHLIEHNIQRPVILFLDGHTRRISLETLMFAKENGIILYCLLPYASHILQPIDIAVLEPLRTKYSEVIADCKGKPTKSNLALKDFPYVLMRSLGDSNVQKNAIIGFEAAGLLPFDPSRVKSDEIMEDSDDEGGDFLQEYIDEIATILESKSQRVQVSLQEGMEVTSSEDPVCHPSSDYEAGFKACYEYYRKRLAAVIPPSLQRFYNSVTDKEASQGRMNLDYRIWKEFQKCPPCPTIPSTSSKGTSSSQTSLSANTECLLMQSGEAGPSGYQAISSLEAAALRRFIPLFDRVLIQKAEAVTKTTSGILIPEKSVAKVLTGKVVAVGEGARTETGSVIPPVVAVGDEVMLPEFGGTKVTLEDKDYFLFRDSDLLAKLNKE